MAVKSYDAYGKVCETLALMLQYGDPKTALYLTSEDLDILIEAFIDAYTAGYLRGQLHEICKQK